MTPIKPRMREDQTLLEILDGIPIMPSYQDHFGDVFRWITRPISIPYEFLPSDSLNDFRRIRQSLDSSQL